MLIDKMDYTPSQRRIVAARMMLHRSRSVAEIADALMVHKRTARRVVRDLSTIYPVFEPVPHRYQIDFDLSGDEC